MEKEENTEQKKGGGFEFRKIHSLLLLLFSFLRFHTINLFLKSYLKYWERVLSLQTLFSPRSNKVFSSRCIVLVYAWNMVAAHMIAYTARCYKDRKSLVLFLFAC